MRHLEAISHSSSGHAFRARASAVCAALALAALPPIAASADQAQLGSAALASGGATHADGWIALVAIAVGAVLAVLYLRGMYLVLHYASLTYDVPLDRVDDAGYSGSRERRLLSVGSVGLVVISALIIVSYGLNWRFLYIGPALSLLGPIVIIASMESDLRKYRRALGIAANVRRNERDLVEGPAVSV